MRSKEILASLAVAGAVAVFALFNINNSTTSSSTFLQISEVEQAFNRYIAKHGRSFGTRQEYQHRLSIFVNNFKKIMEHNMMNAEDEGFTMTLNQFSDMTEAEFKKFTGRKAKPAGENKKYEHLPIDTLPDSVNWLTAGKVQGPKDQGSCGSCWAFSAVGALEGAYAIKTGTLYSLSEQQLVDCSHEGPDGGNQGCDGGWEDYGISYAVDHWMESESDYPYTAKTGKTCKYDSSKGKVKISKRTYVTPKDPAQMKAAVALGPVSVAIQADSYVFQSYGGGIIKSKACGTDLDHAVLVIGYGSENGVDYWLVKNSWGARWGEKGLFRIIRTTDKSVGICGVLAEPVYAVV